MTWTDRYLAAVLRSIAEDKRADVQRELRSSITDAIDERVGAGEDAMDAELPDGHVVVGPPNVAHGFTNTGIGELRLVAIHGAPRFKTEWLAGDVHEVLVVIDEHLGDPVGVLEVAVADERKGAEDGGAALHRAVGPGELVQARPAACPGGTRRPPRSRSGRRGPTEAYGVANPGNLS